MTKKLKLTFISIFSLLLTLSLALFLFLRSSLAPLEGTLKIKNLSHSVKVLRDDYGIPHIHAQTKLDALRVLGFVNASERLFQMEMARRMTQGELSEIFGEIALKSDKLYRSLMLKKAMERMIELEKQEQRFDQNVWNEMLAYCDGINQFINTQTPPYELTLLGIRPRPFTPLDAYILTGHMAYSFGIAIKSEPVMTSLAQTLDPKKFQELRNDRLPQGQSSAALQLKKSFALATEGLFTPSFEGSNAWLVAPHRSQSGKSLFANDPHIGFSHPAVWAEAHIVTPEFELYGHYLPSVPFAILGHNRHHAWGFTMSLTDDMDLYRETLDRKSKTVLFNKKPVPYKEWQEIIKVKNKPDVVLNMIETPHGPLLDAILEEPNLSLKWAYHSPRNNPLKALRNMATATTLPDFEKALQLGTAPGLNVMYADAENIAWWMFGEVAVKKNPHSDQIFDGSSGDDEYLRMMTWNEKPHLVNPPEGFIVTANSRPSQMPQTIRGDWQSDDRFQTISKELQKQEKWSEDDFKMLQTKNFNFRTEVILATLLKNLKLSADEQQKYHKALELLKSWNFQSEENSAAAALYHTWNNENILLMLKDLNDEKRDTYLSTPFAWYFYQRAITNPQADTWRDLDFSAVVTQGFLSTATKLAALPPWGALHTVEYKHALGRSFPLNKILNLGPYPVAGAYNDINNNKMGALGGDLKVVAGPSTRRIIDFAHPEKSWGIIPTGVSGHLLSPYYRNQVDLFLKGQYRPQLLNEDDYHKSSSPELEFHELL